MRWIICIDVENKQTSFYICDPSKEVENEEICGLTNDLKKAEIFYDPAEGLEQAKLWLLRYPTCHHVGNIVSAITLITFEDEETLLLSEEGREEIPFSDS